VYSLWLTVWTSEKSSRKMSSMSTKIADRLTHDNWIALLAIEGMYFRISGSK